MLETVACNLCGSTHNTPVYKKPDTLLHPPQWFTVVECDACGLGFTNPRPTRKTMDEHYPSEFFGTFQEETQYHAKRYAREAALVQRYVKRPAGRLLDVGCAGGDFARVMAGLGWTVEGVETASNAPAMNDFPVYRCEFSDIPVDTPTYDVVTAWAVIEHVHDPMSYFKKARQVLKPGGFFVLLVTNFSSVSSRCLFREDVPRHLYFFTEPCMKRYFEMVNLEFVDSRYHKDIYAMEPSHWLRYQLFYRLRNRPYLWEDVDQGYAAYLQKSGASPGVGATLRYGLGHPFYLVDRLVTPIVGQWQILRKQYGIVTYIARRPE